LTAPNPDKRAITVTPITPILNTRDSIEKNPCPYEEKHLKGGIKLPKALI